MSILREKMVEDLTSFFTASLDCMSDEEIKKLHKETFTELANRIEREILFGEQNDRD